MINAKHEYAKHRRNMKTKNDQKRKLKMKNEFIEHVELQLEIGLKLYDLRVSRFL